jgi:hypothetical protein
MADKGRSFPRARGAATSTVGRAETPRWGSFRTTEPGYGPGAGKVRVSHWPRPSRQVPGDSTMMTYGAVIDTRPMNTARSGVPQAAGVRAKVEVVRRA